MLILRVAYRSVVLGELEDVRDEAAIKRLNVAAAERKGMAEGGGGLEERSGGLDQGRQSVESDGIIVGID